MCGGAMGCEGRNNFTVKAIKLRSGHGLFSEEMFLGYLCGTSFILQQGVILNIILCSHWNIEKLPKDVKFS